MANSLCETCLQGIMVSVFIISDWIFVLMNTTTMIPCSRVIEGIGHLKKKINYKVSLSFLLKTKKRSISLNNDDND